MFDDNASLLEMAEWADTKSGIAERATFFGRRRERLFGVTYLPIGREATAGVVLCPPLLAQFNAYYRKGTILARSLAAHGIAVQKFHYRGTGNSDGDVGSTTLETLVEDTAEATSALLSHTREIPVGYVGVSLGAYPAAVASVPGSPLVLDSAPPSGRAFFRKAFRSHAVAKMREGETETPDTKTLVERLLASDDVALLSFRLPRSLYLDLEGRQLVEEIGSRPRPVLIVERNRSGELGPDGKNLSENLTRLAFPVEKSVSKKEDPFWYVDDSAPERSPEVAESNYNIGLWLKKALGLQQDAR